MPHPLLASPSWALFCAADPAEPHSHTPLHRTTIPPLETLLPPVPQVPTTPLAIVAVPPLLPLTFSHQSLSRTQLPVSLRCSAGDVQQGPLRPLRTHKSQPSLLHAPSPVQPPQAPLACLLAQGRVTAFASFPILIRAGPSASTPYRAM